MKYLISLFTLFIFIGHITTAQMFDTHFPENEIRFQYGDTLEINSKPAPVDKEANWIGYLEEVNWVIANKAQQIISTSTGDYYRLYISVKNASKCHLYFDNIQYDQGIQLSVYPSLNQRIGPYTANYPTKSIVELPNQVVVELFIPHGKNSTASIAEIGIEPKDDFELKNSGPCMVDVNCAEGDDWQIQKRSVVRLLIKAGNQLFTCTGSIVNNTQQDKTPYMLTAHHCIESSSEEDLEEVSVEFNYEAEICGGDEPLINNQIINRTRLLSFSPLSGGSDFALFLLEDTIPDSFNPFYAGWDRSNNGAQSGTGIHHPNGDIKKISTFDDPTGTITMNDGETDAFWVMRWDATENGHSVTSFGSSGSPLFDENKRIIGTLSGGQASCNNLNGQDAYGKLHYHWELVGNDSTSRLSDWLDPTNTGLQRMNGLNIEVEPEEPDTIDLSKDFAVKALNAPFSNQVELLIQNEASTLYEIDLVEVGSGKIVWKSSATVEFEGQLSFPLSQSLSNGIYILRVYNRTAFATVKVAVYQNPF
jgi:hypothetical protein